MTSNKKKYSVGIWIITIIAIAFGLLTIKSGGSVLFIDGEARQAAGNYVPFVLWFNFSAGFAYVLAGVGLFLQKRWASLLAIFIAVATIIVFAFFGLHVLNDGLFEFRTVAAMSFRTVIWTSIAIFVYLKIIKK